MLELNIESILTALPCSFAFLSSPEFYVIAFVVAAAVIALMARPSSSAPVSEHLLSSELLTASAAASLTAANPAEPAIEIICDADGSALLLRHGLAGMNASGAVSAKVIVKGFNITVYERIVSPRFSSSTPSNVSSSAPPSNVSIAATPSNVSIAAAPSNVSIADEAPRPTPTALFRLDFLSPERYYVRYESETLSSAATLAFRAVEGYHAGPVSLKQ